MIWELMIGRDNCRFPWGSPAGAAEPTTPFHGLIYPDGHPWSLEDAMNLQGGSSGVSEGFHVTYYSDSRFGALKKTSLVPHIDFDLNTEPGTEASDASAGIGNTKWSNRYRGKLRPLQSGEYTLTLDIEGAARVEIDGRPILATVDTGTRHRVSGHVLLQRGHAYHLMVEYARESGSPHLHLYWSRTGMAQQLVSADRQRITVSRPPPRRSLPILYRNTPVWPRE